jgi:type I restriction enzyme, S subunit
MFGDLEKRETKRPIGSVCEVSSGSTPRRDDDSNFGGDIPWVKTTEVKGSLITKTEERVTEQGVASARLRLYPKGTVLVAMYGQGVTRGKAGILGIDSTVNQACAALIPSSEINSIFLLHQLKQNYELLRGLGRGGNQPNLNGQLVRDFEILVPSMTQQLCFVSTIEKIESQIRIMNRSLAASETFFSSLQYRAFSGQL